MRYDLSIEQVVLGALMIDASAYEHVADILPAHYFYDPRHKAIFAAIEDLSRHDRAIDITTVAERLRSRGTLDEAGGVSYLVDIAHRVGSTAHLSDHIAVLREKAVARSIEQIGSALVHNAQDEKVDIEPCIGAAVDQLEDLQHDTELEHAEQISPMLDEAYKVIDENRNKPDGITGIPSGFTEVDKLLGGWQNSHMIIIGARPAMGKTALALSMIRYMAVEKNIPCAFFSVEMSAMDIMMRLTSMQTQIGGERLIHGRLNELDMSSVRSAQLVLGRAPIYLMEKGDLNIRKLSAEVKRLVRQHQIQCVLVDYIQLMEDNNGNRNQTRENEVSRISRGIKVLAKKVHIPIIALAQVNRNATFGAEVRPPRLEDLRESGSLEQDADVVCFIHRPEYYKYHNRDQTTLAEGNSKPGLTEFIIAKNRHGPTATITLQFRHGLAQFGNPPEEWKDPSRPPLIREDGGEAERRMGGEEKKTNIQEKIPF